MFIKKEKHKCKCSKEKHKCKCVEEQKHTKEQEQNKIEKEELNNCECIEKEQHLKEQKQSGKENEELNDRDKWMQEAIEFKNKYLQLLADSQNARKRLFKEKEELRSYIMQDLLLEFLVPIDHMENALQFTGQAAKEVQMWAKGFEMILTQLKDVLSNKGVRVMETVGKSFDPYLHEAIEMLETTEFAPGIIVEESMRGYLIGNRVLRPARVKVAKKPKEDEALSENSESKEDINVEK